MCVDFFLRLFYCTWTIQIINSMFRVKRLDKIEGDRLNKQLELAEKELVLAKEQLDLSKLSIFLLGAFLALPPYKALWNFCFKNQEAKVAPAKFNGKVAQAKFNGKVASAKVDGKVAPAKFKGRVAPEKVEKFVATFEASKDATLAGDLVQFEDLMQ